MLIDVATVALASVFGFRNKNRDLSTGALLENSSQLCSVYPKLAA
jgi:hypothetical protein